VRSRGKSLTAAEKRVLQSLAACRTAALGGHLECCDRCGHNRPVYNSCRDRHCPKCQGAARAAWLDARREELLPVEYFHVVFTIPAAVAQIAWQNKRVVYDILFETAAATLREIAADPKHLGAQIGCLCVLHTWGQNLLHHPHVHCVVPGGGIAPDESRWVSCRPGFFLPVRVLSRMFRGKFLQRLRQAYAGGQLQFHGSLRTQGTPEGWSRLLAESYRQEWVVYAKPPFGGPEQVLKYLARYTHRVAISNDRLLNCEQGCVTFRWKDYAADSRIRAMTLSASEFLRRFLLHVLPSGFVRIRHYGFLANCHRQEKLALCRKLLFQPASEPVAPPASDPVVVSPESPAPTCPVCAQGRMLIIERHERPKLGAIMRMMLFDSS
jgi:hypothetical protein